MCVEKVKQSGNENLTNRVHGRCIKVDVGEIIYTRIFLSHKDNINTEVVYLHQCSYGLKMEDCSLIQFYILR